jgi:hypothetical protein
MADTMKVFYRLRHPLISNDLPAFRGDLLPPCSCLKIHWIYTGPCRVTSRRTVISKVKMVHVILTTTRHIVQTLIIIIKLESDSIITLKLTRLSLGSLTPCPVQAYKN